MTASAKLSKDAPAATKYSPPQRLLVIGLDSADPDLLLQWCDSGDLPNLARLREEGTWGRLATFPGLADDAIWSSFCTGAHPGHHGRYDFQQFASATYSERRMRDQSLHLTPFWKTLSDAGKRVAVVDVPKTPLTVGLNGFQLSDWLVHGRDGPTRSYPRELAAEISTSYGCDKNDVFINGKCLCSPWSLSKEDQDALRNEVLDSVERKTAALEDLMQRDSSDLFLCVFKESHCAGHQFWHLLDEAGRQCTHSSSKHGKRPSNTIKAVYKALDCAIARLIARTDDETAVIVFSDLGMSTNHSGEHLLEAVLLRLESNPLLRLWGRIYYLSARFGRLKRFINKVNRQLRRYRTAMQLSHNSISGAIRVNLEGRESHGRIAAGQEYAEFCERLEDELLRLRDPLTGNPIVAEVTHSAKTLVGPRTVDLPDLFVIWHRELPINGAQSSSIGRISLNAPAYRPGNHVPGGIYFSRDRGRSESKQDVGSSITDLAPTIAAMLGVELATASGKPIEALVQAGAGREPESGR